MALVWHFEGSFYGIILKVLHVLKCLVTTVIVFSSEAKIVFSQFRFRVEFDQEKHARCAAAKIAEDQLNISDQH